MYSVRLPPFWPAKTPLYFYFCSFPQLIRHVSLLDNRGVASRGTPSRLRSEAWLEGILVHETGNFRLWESHFFGQSAADLPLSLLLGQQHMQIGDGPIQYTPCVFVNIRTSASQAVVNCVVIISPNCADCLAPNWFPSSQDLEPLGTCCCRSR